MFSYSIFAFRLRPTYLPERPSFRASSWNVVPCPNFPLFSISTIGPIWPRPLRHAVLASRVIPLWAAHNSFRDAPLPWVRFLVRPQGPMARWLSPYRFVSAPTGFTAASWLVTSSITAEDSTSTEVGSLLSRQASVAFWQGVAYFRHVLFSIILVSILAIVRSWMAFTLASDLSFRNSWATHISAYISLDWRPPWLGRFSFLPAGMPTFVPRP
jgi:hypothetical protein